MPETRTKLADAILKSKAFDPEFYRRRYPDVDMSGLDPAQHYRRYGVLMRRAAGPGLAENPARLADYLPPPRARQSLRMAARMAEEYGYDVAVRYARAHVPQETAYTIDTLRANRALAAGDRAGWLTHLNRYIGHFGAAPITWAKDAGAEGAGTHLIDRFSADGLVPVTGGPLVSVIMPAWNAQATIAAAARSVLNQTWRNLELLIVDDASTDGTWGEMQQIAASDSRVRILRGRVNAGPYVAKNIALTMARGDWITGHDADDWAHPQRIEQHIGAILSAPTPPRASVPKMARLNPDGVVVRFAVESSYSTDGVTRMCPIATTFRTDFLRDTLGGWDCARFGADSELMSRTETLIGDEFTRLSLIAMFAIEMEGSLTNHPESGINPETGLSQTRKDYAAGWRQWHATLSPDQPEAARLHFPPQPGTPRPFAAPQGGAVPDDVVRHNLAAMTGLESTTTEAK
ncbi:MAG: glycosyltransferase family 2 protein [Paracoccus sp. (in: a-proteobacteria)]|uniref:glycosyltransferase family 2 protein n=1 Tax=Paracoccus sp. TaxID=267 RepID=UPI0026E08C59|nr:glycosyltransferase family 2 protein [Paracoccus sp. (in: a-proteobacteria)]MDO5611753.1 glycosyltransferase family 2 protein [Paracoccus sp. (in: a-proteobacteria)]